MKMILEKKCTNLQYSKNLRIGVFCNEDMNYLGRILYVYLALQEHKSEHSLDSIANNLGLTIKEIEEGMTELHDAGLADYYKKYGRQEKQYIFQENRIEDIEIELWG